MAWLVHRGEVVSASQTHEAALSFWTTRYLASVKGDATRARRYRAELALDAIRQRCHPTAISRLAGFYVFPDEETALRAGQAWDGRFRPEHLVELALRPGARTSRHDSEWIAQRLEGQDDLGWAGDYFAGNALGGDPIWEILVDGRAVVLGTDLRRAAYDVVKKAWPQSLALLELARIGVELDSDLGLISPLLLQEGDRLRVDYAMNFRDATDDVFLNRLAALEGPRNTNDLQLDSELVKPDLRNTGKRSKASRSASRRSRRRESGRVVEAPGAGLAELERGRRCGRPSDGSAR
ncbi:MAG TPA: hypothetical protein VG898_06755 [Solirubrobacterales bacterium]|nr:hypothetical protein [Solirubrobacterales bacterium]